MAAVTIKHLVHSAHLIFFADFKHQVVILAVMAEILLVETTELFNGRFAPDPDGTRAVNAQDVIAIIFQMLYDTEII